MSKSILWNKKFNLPAWHDADPGIAYCYDRHHVFDKAKWFDEWGREMCDCKCGTAAEKRLADAMVAYANSHPGCDAGHLIYEHDRPNFRVPIVDALAAIISERAPKIDVKVMVSDANNPPSFPWTHYATPSEVDVILKAIGYKK